MKLNPLHITINLKFNREKQAMRKKMHAFSLSPLCHSKNGRFEIYGRKGFNFLFNDIQIKMSSQNKCNMVGGLCFKCMS